MAKPINPPITDHADRAIARSPGFTLESPNLNRLRRALNVGIQNLEDLLDDFLNLQAISTAEGVQLDNIGTILNLARITGQSDAVYAAALLARAAGLATSGTMEQLLDVYALLFDPAPIKIYATDLYPATFELTAVLGVGEDDGDPTDAAILTAMGGTKAAGVERILQVVEEAAFLFGDSDDADANGNITPDVDHGLGGSVTGASLFLLGDATDGKLGQTYNRLTASKTIPSGEGSTESTTGGNLARVLI